jgi:hypothetical protein
VKGHQDDKKDISELDNWALLNIRCDHNAKEYRTQPNLVPRPNLRFRYEQCSLYLHGEKLSCFHIPSIYARVFPDTMAYWKVKHGLSDDNIEEHIDWEALRRAAKRIPLGTRRWLTKHASGHCAVGRMELRRKHWDHSNCPRCGEPDETTLHILTCTDQRAKEQWQHLLCKLSVWMTKHHTPEILPNFQRKVHHRAQRQYQAFCHS